MSPGLASLARKAALGAEVVVTYVWVSRLLRRRDLRTTVALLQAGGGSSGAAPGHYCEGVRIGQAVSRVLRVLPADDRCLKRSLVLTRMLARRGVASSMVIGVRPSPDFAAHAWVEHDGHPLLASGPREYRRLVEL